MEVRRKRDFEISSMGRSHRWSFPHPDRSRRFILSFDILKMIHRAVGILKAFVRLADSSGLSLGFVTELGSGRGVTVRRLRCCRVFVSG
jgi:hypothetical protein